MNRVHVLLLWLAVIAFAVAAYVGFGQADGAMADDFNAWFAVAFGLWAASHATRET